MRDLRMSDGIQLQPLGDLKRRLFFAKLVRLNSDMVNYLTDEKYFVNTNVRKYFKKQVQKELSVYDVGWPITITASLG